MSVTTDHLPDSSTFDKGTRRQKDKHSGGHLDIIPMGNYYRFNPNGYLKCPSDIIFSDNPEIVDAVLSAEGVKNVKDMSGR